MDVYYSFTRKTTERIYMKPLSSYISTLAIIYRDNHHIHGLSCGQKLVFYKKRYMCKCDV